MSAQPQPGPVRVGPPPATGAWREADPPGRRQFVDLGRLGLEAAPALPSVRMAYETWGTPRLGADGAVANAVLVLHALTGDSHVVGEAGPGHPTPGWWSGLVGSGRPIDTDRYWVVAPNVLGGCQGTTGPASRAPDGRPWGSRFPFITVRDQVAAEVVLADRLGVRAWALVLGGSMGGMRVLEWGAGHPDRVDRMLVLASSAIATADQIAWCAPQLAAIRGDPGWRGGDYHDLPDGRGPHAGLGVARRVAQVSYRSAGELGMRFGRHAQAGEDPLGGGGRYAVESYLDHHADKLVRRFDAASYVCLTEAMSSHDVGRGRGGVESALGLVRARTVVAAIDSDRLYPVELSAQVAAAVSGCAGLDLVESVHGHDGFLLESAAVGRLAADLLSAPRPGTG